MSAYRSQLQDARNDIGIKNVAGKCANSAEFSDLINRVTRRLLKRGAWWGSEVVVKLCVYGCDIVWPRYVGTVMGIRTCCGGQMEIKNNWYSILGPHHGHSIGWHSDLHMTDNGTAPCYSEISGNTGKFIRYHIVKNEDVGKTITFFGKQYGAQPLQELVNGVWQMGQTLIAVPPVAPPAVSYTQTTTLVTKIEEVTRQATQGMTYLYEVDPTTGLLRDLAVYEPNETNPQYRRSTIHGINALPSYTDSYGRKVRTIEALVKLEFVPVVNDRDFLLVDDFDALAMGIKALRLEEADDAQNAEIYFTKAIRELNFESRNRNPGSQFVVKSNVMGSSRTICNPI